jgi:hypothetical protein
MPSFMKKALDAANQAKGRLDEYRATQDAASIAPVEHTPDPQDVAALTGALRRGAVDPRPLLTRDEAAEVAGQPLGGPQLTYSDQSLGVRYAAQDRRGRRWSVELVTWYLEDGADDVDAVWEMLQPAWELGEALDGVGRTAYWDGSRLYVRADPVVFHVEVSVPDEVSSRGRARLAAQDVLARL